MEFETRLNETAARVFDIWTCNGLGLDDDTAAQARKSAQDAANNTYLDGISDDDWTFAACMKFLSL